VSPAEASAAFDLLAIVAVLALAAAWLVVMASLIRRRGRFRWRRRGYRDTVWLGHPNKKREKVISQSEFSENSLFEMTLCIVTGASAHRGVCAALPLRYHGQYTGAPGARSMESIL